MIRDEHLIGLGEIMISFATLENMILDTFIITLITNGPSKDAPVGQMVCAQLTFSTKVDLISSLFPFRCADASLRERMNASLTKAKGMNTIRNRIVHSAWIADVSDTGKLFREKTTAKFGVGLNTETHQYTGRELKGIAKEIDQVNVDLFKIYSDWYDQLRPRLK